MDGPGQQLCACSMSSGQLESVLVKLNGFLLIHVLLQSKQATNHVSQSQVLTHTQVRMTRYVSFARIGFGREECLAMSGRETRP